MDHAIKGLRDSAMSNIKSMVDVDTVVGDAVECGEGTVIIPISTVSFGFGAGGSEIPAQKEGALPFGGGSGGGIKVKPVAFLVISKDRIRILCEIYCNLSRNRV